MKLRLFLILFSISTIFLFVEWKTADASKDFSTAVSMKKKKRPKKKKTKKKKSPPKKSSHEKEAMTARDSAHVKKRADKRDKNLQKLLDKKAKKQKKADKETAAENKPLDKCDSSDLVRTSKDTAILVKYIRIYRTLGGVCYILHLQDMADLKQDSVGKYSVKIKPSKDPRAPAAWQTYLYCPIGKPDGMVMLLSPTGDTLQVCFYKDEKKNGLMTYFKKGKGIIYQEKYLNDEKVWERKPDE